MRRRGRVAAVAAVGLAAGLLLYQATIAAAVFYLLVYVGVMAFGSDWAAVWLLRMPAASAVGVIALVSILPGDWLRRLADGWLATFALVAVSFGYLAIEVRNHGVAAWASVRRALSVVAVGAAHALMVSLIGLVVVAPAFVAAARSSRRCGGTRLPPCRDAARAGGGLVPGGRGVLPDSVGRPPDHRPAGALELAEQVNRGGVMEWTTLTLQVTTPLFNGGADPDGSAASGPTMRRASASPPSGARCVSGSGPWPAC